jgi:sugar phosphate isomerase/epimerase
MHAGETWDQVLRGLREFTLPIRRRLCPGAGFGVGLWLSELASRELTEQERLREFRAFCAGEGLYVFTLNGFPFGRFHGRVVKEDVFRPDWRSPERLEYTNRLADILSHLLPAGLEGSISTVPCSFKGFIRSKDEIDRMVEHLALHVAHLARIREATGQVIHLGLEPEPMGFVETTDELIRFVRQHVFTRGLGHLVRHAGCPEDTALEWLRTHLGMCYDTCHQAIQYEEPQDVIRRLAAAGIRVSKVQVSSAMRVALPAGPGGDDGASEVLAQLERFVEPTYLHQVVERLPEGIRRHKDLDLALAAFRAERAHRPSEAREWRVHFHLPVFLPEVGLIGSTRDHIQRLFADLKDPGAIQHLEIETYTWSILPASYKDSGLVEAVVREFDWVLAALAGQAPPD